MHLPLEKSIAPNYARIYSYREHAVIKQANPSVLKLGVGPYHLIYKNKELVRYQCLRECRQHLSNIVSEKWALDSQIKALKKQFAEKWNLTDYPESF